jgi:hypothetical protein
MDIRRLLAKTALFEQRIVVLAREDKATLQKRAVLAQELAEKAAKLARELTERYQKG